MPLLLRDITIPLGTPEERVRDEAARILGIPPSSFTSFCITRIGIDARKKSQIVRVCHVEFSCAQEKELLARHGKRLNLAEASVPEQPPVVRVTRPHRALVVGMGPAGLFAALLLAQSGISVCLLERGSKVEDRAREVDRFWSDATLDPESNVQFGEGGAGTFSDGKLTTRKNHPWNHFVLQSLVDHGAPEDILRQAKPHVGTDILRTVLVRMRQTLISLGVEIRFRTRLDGLVTQNSVITAGRTAAGEEIPCDSLLLAPGHSARDTYRMLHAAGVAMEAKPFAIGARVEHPREMINEIQYGHRDHPHLPSAEYAVAWNNPVSGRGIYSFCMCPGGEVVNASSAEGMLVVNGMSHHHRRSPASNSALVVSVRPGDFPFGVLGGVLFQEEWERQAFRVGGSDYSAPAQNLLDFLGQGRGAIRTSVRPGWRQADLADCLPPFIVDELRGGIGQFERRMRGFITAEATLTGIETRTSAPVRIMRDDNGESPSHRGLYPLGEGAGYAGGIMSAALDGLRTAANIVAALKE